jgi:hypothetical protein
MEVTGLIDTVDLRAIPLLFKPFQLFAKPP